MSNPTGICKCGCGQKTTVSEYTWAKYGYVKGEPRDYLKGHSGRGKRLSDPSKDLPVNHNGLCLCGCGEKTPIATYTNRPLGIYEGMPVRHIRGHQSKQRKNLERYKVTNTGFETPCWLWTGPIDVQGYGKHGGRSQVAHKAVYESIRGTVQRGLFLHHKCEQKSCVNPDHLEPLSRSEHMREHALMRISEDKIEAIRRDVSGDIPRGTARRVAEKHDVSYALVWRIWKGQR
jgi:hypothetical protein